VHFLLDPAIRIGKEWEQEKGIRLSSLGVRTFFEKTEDGEEVMHIIDVVGKQHYPNLADYVEEMGRYGISRKLSRRLNLSGLSKKSRLYLAHDKAWVSNIYDYGDWKCLKNKHVHKPGVLPKEDCCCSGIWWQDLNPDGCQTVRGRLVRRTMPSFKYQGYVRPEGVVPLYERGIFAIFPLGGANLTVINGPGAEEATAAAQRASLPIEQSED